MVRESDRARCLDVVRRPCCKSSQALNRGLYHRGAFVAQGRAGDGIGVQEYVQAIQRVGREEWRALSRVGSRAGVSRGHQRNEAVCRIGDVPRPRTRRARIEVDRTREPTSAENAIVGGEIVMTDDLVSWDHIILVEKVTATDDAVPLCVDGGRACPREGCGGAWGYSEMLDALKSPNEDEREDAQYELGDDFDPDRFEKDAVNRRLAQKFGPAPAKKKRTKVRK
jgi:hypothetical protein